MKISVLIDGIFTTVEAPADVPLKAIVQTALSNIGSKVPPEQFRCFANRYPLDQDEPLFSQTIKDQSGKDLGITVFNVGLTLCIVDKEKALNIIQRPSPYR